MGNLFLLKHYKNRGFNKFGVFLLLKEKKIGKKNNNWNLWILVFWSKNGRFVTHNCFSNKRAWNPYIYSVFLGSGFVGQGVKKGKFWKATQKKKNLTDNWKAIVWWYFCCFFFGFYFFLFFFVLCLFLGGFKGQVRWPEGPPHLALNLPFFLFFFFLFFFFCFFFFCFFCCFFVFFFVFCFFGGFKGQGRWPEGPPHLALNPPYLFLLFLLFCFFFCFLFCFLVFKYKKKTSFSPRKGHSLFIFSVSLSFSLSLFWLPSFSVSLSLSLSLSSSLLSFFLLVFPFCFLLVPCFCLFLSFSFFFAFFHERNNIKILNCKFVFINFFLSFWFPVFFLFQVPFSYLCYFLILSYVFSSTSRFLISKQTTEKNNFLVKRGVATKRFFYQPVFWKMWKVIVFLVSLFWANFGWCSKNTIKMGFKHIFKSKKLKKMAIFNSY